MNDFFETSNGFGSRALETLLSPGPDATESLLSRCDQRICGQEWWLECDDFVAIELIDHVNHLKQKVRDGNTIVLIGIRSSKRRMKFRVNAQYNLHQRLENLVMNENNLLAYEPDFAAVFSRKSATESQAIAAVEELDNLPCQRASITGYEISS